MPRWQQNQRNQYRQSRYDLDLDEDEIAALLSAKNYVERTCNKRTESLRIAGRAMDRFNNLVGAEIFEFNFNLDGRRGETFRNVNLNWGAARRLQTANNAQAQTQARLAEQQREIERLRFHNRNLEHTVREMWLERVRAELPRPAIFASELDSEEDEPFEIERPYDVRAEQQNQEEAPAAAGPANLQDYGHDTEDEPYYPPAVGADTAEPEQQNQEEAPDAVELIEISAYEIEEIKRENEEVFATTDEEDLELPESDLETEVNRKKNSTSCSWEWRHAWCWQKLILW